MTKFVQPEKRQKRQQQADAKRRRGVWNMNPITRVVKNKKVYTRKGRKSGPFAKGG